MSAHWVIVQEDLLSLRLELRNGKCTVQVDHYYKSWMISGGGTNMLLGYARRQAKRMNAALGLDLPITKESRLPEGKWRTQKPYTTVIGG